jgi:hypothetical protein
VPDLKYFIPYSSLIILFRELICSALLRKVMGRIQSPRSVALGGRWKEQNLRGLDAGGNAHSALRVMSVELGVVFYQLFHLFHFLNDVLGSLSVTNVVDGADEDDYKPDRFVPDTSCPIL